MGCQKVFFEIKIALGKKTFDNQGILKVCSAVPRLIGRLLETISFESIFQNGTTLAISRNQEKLLF